MIRANGWTATLTAVAVLAALVPASTAAATDTDPADDDPEVVRALTSACEDASASGFRDRGDAGVHAEAVDCVAWWQVASGFPDGTFRPGQEVTRGQMASFIATAILAAGGTLPAPVSDLSDTAGTTHQRPIARLTAAGIVQGYPDGTFRPGQEVSRAQMATFLMGALDHLDVPAIIADPAVGEPTSTSAGGFTDVDGDTHATAILAAADAGIAGGYQDGTYRPEQPVIRAQMATFLARLLTTFTDGGGAPRAAYAAIDREALEEAICRPSDADEVRAKEFLAGRYHFAPHREVELGTDLSWDEDPVGDSNWRFQLHTLRWLWPLIGATNQTGDPRYLDHAYAMARSWVEANPFEDPAGDFAWNDHSTAWRARVLGCLMLQGPAPGWLTDSVIEHRERLADPSFYVQHGNHALNQDSGMLALACLTQAWDRRDLATERVGVLARASVDAQGVTNEQSVEYQDYNYTQYRDALNFAEACGMPAPSWADRIARMPVVLTHMTQPDDTYVTLGDTDRRRAKFAIDHPNLRWMSTGGDSGEPPEQTFVTYDAGFTFARSGWGTERHRRDENLLSVRHGEPRQLHGHRDHGSVTLFGDGQPLIPDPGKYAYGDSAERLHVVSAEAHNLVTIGSDCLAPGDRRSEVTNVASDEHVDRLTVQVATCTGTGWTRTLGFVRDTGELVVVDEVRDPSQRSVVQRWQLEVGADVEVVRPDLVHATWPSGAQLVVEQLTPVASTTSVAGGRDPLRGWVSERFGELTPAANLEATAPRGTSATFVTVLRPGVTPTAAPSDVQRSTDATTVTLVTSSGQHRIVTLPRVDP